MSEDFPYTIKQLLPIISVLEAGGEQYGQLTKFFGTTLPPGFPVKGKIPLALSFSLEFTFKAATKKENDIKEFVVPEDYTYFNPLLDVPIQQELLLESGEKVLVTGLLNLNNNPPDIHDVIVKDSKDREIQMNVDDLKKMGLEDAIQQKITEVNIETDKKNERKSKKQKKQKEIEPIKKDEEPRIEIIEEDVIE